MRTIKKIVAFRNDRFGEFLLNIPAFRALKEKYTGSSLSVVVCPEVLELAKHINIIDELIPWESRKHSLPEVLEFSRKLKSGAFDAAVMLNPKKEFNLAVYLAGIPVRVGYNRKWGFLLTHKMKDLKSQGAKHEVEYNLELVKLIGAETADKGVALDNIPEILDYRNAIAVHPYTSDPVKLWPIERFKELVNKISREFKERVIIIGKSESRIDWGDGVSDLTNKTSLVELAGILKNCRLLISGDSGPAHLAGSVDTPAVALFRNDLQGKNPERWGPWSKDNVVIAKSSLKDISVDEVLKALTGSKL
ncbi:MAG: glycosyltransferase family 9 protein, partial [Candidatus Omnitrophica bacterium]|nr:glycosyltransferase family 9 protein [Candidatus Omnitrophota bacterium]